MTLSGLILAYNATILAYFIIVDGFYLIMTLVAFWDILRYRLQAPLISNYRLYRSTLTPPVSILIPAYNEEATIVESVRGMSLLRYPEHEIIVVSDGSTDRTLEVLIERFDLRPVERAALRPLGHQAVRGIYASPTYPNLVVIDKVNGGKADALNAGIAYSRCPLFCAIDADSLLQEDALERVVQPFIDQPSTVAAGGFLRIANGCSVSAGRVSQVKLPKSPVALVQIVEYLRAFYLGRMGWNPTGGLLIISGAFGIFRTAVVAEVGGYLTGSVGEDMELVVRLHRHLREQKRPYRVAFVPDPICWTEVPESLLVLGRQRDRWQRGLLDTLVRHRGMLFSPRYGAAGMVAMPYFWLVEVLGPIVELSGFVVIPIMALLGAVNLVGLKIFLLFSILFGLFLSISAVLAEEVSFRQFRTVRQLLALVLVAVVENVGYRQLHNWWRLKGLISYLRGKGQWGDMQRKGFKQAGS